MTNIEECYKIYIYNIDNLTLKPKTLQDIYTQNTGKRSEKIDHTGYFLEHGKMIDGNKKELEDILSINNKNEFEIVDINKSYITDIQKYVLEYYLKYNGLDNSKINNFEKVGFEYFREYFNIIQEELSDIGIILNINQYKKINGFIYKGDIDYMGGVRGCHYKSNIVLGNNPHKITIFHELAHYISNGGYNNKGDFLDECFTEILAYKCCKKIKGENEKLNWGHFGSINIISKIVELISIKINKRPEYILNYILRGYFVKGNKGLSIFYKVFGVDFIKDFMFLGTQKKEDLENYKKIIINLSQTYKKFGFNSKYEFVKYFDSTSLPSKEIGDIMGIER